MSGRLVDLKNNIYEKIRDIAARNRLAARIVSELYFIKYSTADRLEEEVLKFIRPIVPADELEDKRKMHSLVREILFCRCYYQISEKEYFYYRFKELSEYGRHRFIGEFEFKKLYAQLDSKGRPELLNSKELTYEYFKEYFHREAVLIKDPAQKDEFLSFVKKHGPCFLKPLDSYGGKGIRCLEITSDCSADELFEDCRNSFPFLLEEKVVQDPEMAAFHPQSVNTIRYNTFYHNGVLTRINTVLRMGRGGSLVDNATSGGIYAIVDIESGVIISAAHSDRCETYIFHPDTGVQILGAQIPRWSELNSLVDNIVQVVPEQKQVGWDFALTHNGWVLIEGNTAPGLQDFDFDHGMREIIADTFGQVVPVLRW